MFLREPKGLRSVEKECGIFNRMPREKGNRCSVKYISMLAKARRHEHARRAIQLLFMDQPERTEARYRLAAASRQYEDIFALRAILEEGCVGRQPGKKTLAEARLLVGALATMTPPKKKRRRSKKGLEEEDPDEGSPGNDGADEPVLKKAAGA
jgi:hypothetical protein